MDSAERDLIERFRRGDEQAFEQVVRRYDTDVLNLANRILGDLDDARDVRQACFVRALRSRATFDGRARLGTWIYSIAINLCRDQLRRRDAGRRALGAIGSFDRRSVAEAPTAGGAETSRVIAAALDAIPPAEREVIVLRHFQQLAFREIAIATGVTESTARARGRLGLARLRDALCARGIIDPPHPARSACGAGDPS